MEQSLGSGSSSSVQMMSQNLHHMILKFEELQKANNESDARLRNISVENAKLKEEVEVLKKKQGRLHQDQSALQKEKERLKQEQVTLTERQNMLSQYQDQKVSSLRSQLQQLRKNVTTEQEDLKDELLRQNALLRHDVSQAEMKAAILEGRFNRSQRQLPAEIRSLQVRVSDLISVAVADVNGVTKRPQLASLFSSIMHRIENESRGARRFLHWYGKTLLAGSTHEEAGHVKAGSQSRCVRMALMQNSSTKMALGSIYL